MSRKNKALEYYEWVNQRVKLREPISDILYEDYKKKASAATDAPCIPVNLTEQNKSR